MKKNIKRILILPIIICLIFSSLSLYSCSDEPVTRWHYGEKNPDESIVANIGDYYLEYESCDVYTYTEDGWELSFNMKGEAGKDGKNGKNGKAGENGVNWFSGEQKPNQFSGKNGDRYLCTKNMTIYEKKNGKWHYQMGFFDEGAYDFQNDSDGELKILCIGNSFSRDTTSHAPNIFRDLGINNFELGHLYIANCSVQRHYANLVGDPTIVPDKGVQNYEYKLDGGNGWVTKRDYPIEDAVQSQNWDFIVIQHISLGELYPENEDVVYYEKLVNEVKKYHPNATYVWNMTWAYSQEYIDGRSDMNGISQMEKYESIAANTARYYSLDGAVSFFNPIGTAIQNARSSYLGDAMNSDGAHLNSGIGCYTAGLTFVGSITGIDITGVEWRPEAVGEDEQKVAIESAVNALKTPLELTESQYSTKASIVVKDGKSAAVTYTFDDGFQSTASLLKSMLADYENLKLTFALIPGFASESRNLVTLKTALNEETGKYEYVLDKNGNYTYTINEQNVAFWQDIIKNTNGRIEYTSHSLTHAYPGANDDGGIFKYTDGKEVKQKELPVGSATAELYAARQVLFDLFGIDVLTLVEPGVSADEEDVTLDGVLYKGYYEYYLSVVKRMYDEGLLVGGRGVGHADPNTVTTHENLADIDKRLGVAAYSLRAAQGVDSWKQYIDNSAEVGGWALFCIHQVMAEGQTTSAIHIDEAQARELFAYTNSDKYWVTTYEEACKYYAEWSTAEVDSKRVGDKITLTVTDKENNEVYDEALTVKLIIPSGWNACTANGASLEVKTDENGVKFVYVDVVPDSGTVEIIKN